MTYDVVFRLSVFRTKFGSPLLLPFARWQCWQLVAARQRIDNWYWQLSGTTGTLGTTGTT